MSNKIILRYILLILVLIIILSPTLWVFSTSFKSSEEKLFTTPPSIIPKLPTMGNYIDSLDVMNYFRGTFNSFFITISAVLLNLILCSLGAYPLARMNFIGRQTILLSILATFMIPPQVIIVPLYIMVSGLGLGNTYAGVILPMGINALGIFLMYQAFRGIPIELEEAAIIDGATDLQIWSKIMIPLIKPTIAAVSILLFITYWNRFLWPMIILNSEEFYPLQVQLVNLVKGLFGANWRTTAASAVLTSIPPVLFFLWLQKYFISGMMSGALKE